MTKDVLTKLTAFGVAGGVVALVAGTLMELTGIYCFVPLCALGLCALIGAIVFILSGLFFMVND